jgi:hypothetical protein
MATAFNSVGAVGGVVTSLVVPKADVGAETPALFLALTSKS